MLRPHAPFDFRLALGYFGRSPLEVLDLTVNGCYRRAVRLDGRPTLVEVAEEGTIDAPALRVCVLGPAAGTAGLLPLAEQLVARCLRLDEDQAELEQVALGDPVFGGVLARLRGARAPVMPSPFEALIWAIIGQQVNLAFAYRLKRSLVERYGETLAWEERTYHLFPEPARLAAAPVAELRALQFSRQKADYIVTLADLAARGLIDWERLRQTSTAEAIAELATLRGIGRWTAEYVCMRGLGHRDVIPAADLGLRAAIGRAYGFGRHATEPEVRALAERWAGWRSHAAFCWWYTLIGGWGIEP